MCHRASNKTFVYEYVKRFVYLHVTELGCIIGHNVVRVTKHLCMNMSKGLYMYMSQNKDVSQDIMWYE